MAGVLLDVVQQTARDSQAQEGTDEPPGEHACAECRNESRCSHGHERDSTQVPEDTGEDRAQQQRVYGLDQGKQFPDQGHIITPP